MLVRKNVALTTGDQFKVRYMSSWDVNRGAPGDVEPFVMGTDAIAATQNGKNLGVAAAGNQNGRRSIRRHQTGGTPSYYDDVRFHIRKKGKLSTSHRYDL